MVHETEFDDYMFFEYGFPKWITELLQKDYDDDARRLMETKTK